MCIPPAPASMRAAGIRHKARTATAAARIAAAVKPREAAVQRCPAPGIVGMFLQRTTARHEAAVPARQSPGLIEQLAECETAGLRYLPAWMSQREIAQVLFVSLNTTTTH